jgi:hypothetical protein
MKDFIKPLGSFLAGTAVIRLFSKLHAAQTNTPTPEAPKEPSFIKNQITKSHCLNPNLFFGGGHEKIKPYNAFSREFSKECKQLAEQEEKDVFNSFTP